MRTLKFKAQLTIRFFPAVNQNYGALKHRKNKKQNGSKSTNHGLTDVTFWPGWSELLFPERCAQVIDGSEKRKPLVEVWISGIIYTDAVSNRHGFMTLKPHRKQHGFEAFTRNRYNRSRNGDLVTRRSRFVKWTWERVKKSPPSHHVGWTVLIHHTTCQNFLYPFLSFSFHSSGSITPSKELFHQTEVLPGRMAFAFLFVSLERNGREKVSIWTQLCLLFR